MSLSRELLGRAHGALSVAGNGPCVAVLREILNSIEGSVPSPDAAAVVLVSTLGDPTLMYVSSAGAVDLGAIDPSDLRSWSERVGPVQLRFIAALLAHASLSVDSVLPEG